MHENSHSLIHQVSWSFILVSYWAFGRHRHTTNIWDDSHPVWCLNWWYACYLSGRQWRNAFRLYGEALNNGADWWSASAVGDPFGLTREKCFGYLVGYTRSKLRIVSACFSIHGGALTYSSSIDFCWRIYMMGQAVNFEDVDMDLTRRMYMKDPATIYLNIFPWQFPIVRGRGLNKWYSPLG